jgi:hypothetical protein
LVYNWRNLADWAEEIREKQIFRTANRLNSDQDSPKVTWKRKGGVAIREVDHPIDFSVLHEMTL